MKIVVSVKPSAKKTEVHKTGDSEYRVFVTAHPVDGRANSAVIDVLSEFFVVPKSRIRIVNGHASKKKIIEIS